MSDSVLSFAKETAGNLGEFIQEKAGDIGDLAKKGLLVPARGAFLLLLEVNLRGLATKVNKAIERNQQAIKNVWENKVGGDFAKLKSVAASSANKSPFFGSFDPATITAAIASSAAIYALFKPVLEDILGKEEIAKIDNAVQKADEASKSLPEIGAIQTPWGNINWGVTNNKGALLYIGIGAVVLISILYFLTKKK
jgi:hypothetical protein